MAVDRNILTAPDNNPRDSRGPGDRPESLLIIAISLSHHLASTGIFSVILSMARPCEDGGYVEAPWAK